MQILFGVMIYCRAECLEVSASAADIASLFDVSTTFSGRNLGEHLAAPVVVHTIWIAPDAVLALAYGLQVFGLQPKAIQKELPILRPDKLWRIPGTHGPKNPFIVFRRLNDEQLAFFEFQARSQTGGVMS